ncbi:MAG TPA: NUDIX domain-containing protein [Rubrivivax sp.]|nr:NUDIX domain-containing protein [Rubrivivax sp.]HPO18358.1 NUDIX domain-containing protein [Rubrivivax sp.]
MSAAPLPIRPAASLLVLRDAPGGVELLLMRRAERDNDFRSGACVFPGGVLDAADRHAWRWCLGQDDRQASARLGLPHGGLDYFVAALRECFEEVGLLYVCQPDGSAVDLTAHADALREWRQRLHRGQATMAALCAAFDWRLDLRDMAYFAHWLTPVVRPKRFDTRFFVRLAPSGQRALPHMGEALELMWLTPEQALDPQRALKLLNVTQHTLRDMCGFARAEQAWRHARELRGVARHLPVLALGQGGTRFIIEDHPAYDEVARLDPLGRGGVRCELQSGDVQQLSARLWRVAGAARHAYLVRDADGGAVLIGAEVGDAAQAQALRHMAGDAPRRLDPGAGASTLRVGAGTTLLELEDGWLLEQERTLVGGDAAPLPQVEWIAPPHGFLRRARRET